jgi:hypothetical protein
MQNVSSGRYEQGSGGVTERNPHSILTTVCIEWDVLNAFMKDFNACEKFSGDKTSVSGQRLRIFTVKYDLCILLRRVAVKIQMFQADRSNRVSSTVSVTFH